MAEEPPSFPPAVYMCDYKKIAQVPAARVSIDHSLAARADSYAIHRANPTCSWI